MYFKCGRENSFKKILSRLQNYGNNSNDDQLRNDLRNYDAAVSSGCQTAVKKEKQNEEDTCVLMRRDSQKSIVKKKNNNNEQKSVYSRLPVL